MDVMIPARIGSCCMNAMMAIAQRVENIVQTALLQTCKNDVVKAGNIELALKLLRLQTEGMAYVPIVALIHIRLSWSILAKSLQRRSVTGV
jgi:hypothetical protein